LLSYSPRAQLMEESPSRTSKPVSTLPEPISSFSIKELYTLAPWLLQTLSEGQTTLSSTLITQPTPKTSKTAVSETSKSLEEVCLFCTPTTPTSISSQTASFPAWSTQAMSSSFWEDQIYIHYKLRSITSIWLNHHSRASLQHWTPGSNLTPSLALKSHPFHSLAWMSKLQKPTNNFN